MLTQEESEGRCHQNNQKNSWFGQFQTEMKLFHKAAQVISLVVFRFISRKKNNDENHQGYQYVSHFFLVQSA